MSQELEAIASIEEQLRSQKEFDQKKTQPSPPNITSEEMAMVERIFRAPEGDKENQP